MCLRPRKIINKALKNTHGMREFLLVPCGHCSQCIAAKKESLLQRNFFEWQYIKDFCSTGYVFWSTLTFNNEYLPDDFDYSLVSKYIKSVRNRLEYLGYDSEIKYFYVSELGDTTLRPHYHIIWYVHFGVNFSVFEEIVRTLWKYGFTDTREWHYRHLLNDVSGIRYVIKYLNKEYGLESGDKIKTSFRCSKNLGYYPDKYDYTQDVVIPSAKGNQSHHIGNYFLSKMSYEYRTDSFGNKLKTVNGSYMRQISEFGIKWKLDHLDDILEHFYLSNMRIFQHLSDDLRQQFNLLLNGRSFRSFSDYVYLYMGRILGFDSVESDVYDSKKFLDKIYTYNRLMYDIGLIRKNVRLDDTFDSQFEDFDRLFSMLYDIDFKHTKDDSECSLQNSINRLKKISYA